MLLLPKVSSQQEPQLGEFQLVMAGTPPMYGKRGREPNVLYPRFAKPFEPSEQATALIEESPLSYAGSYESESPATSVQIKARMVSGLRCIAAHGDAMPQPFQRPRIEVYVLTYVEESFADGEGVFHWRALHN